MSLLIRPATSPAEIESVRELFREYNASLAAGVRLRGFEDELAALPAGYAPPRGRLYLGFCESRLAACGALRPWGTGGTACELKRMYVRPEFRRRGVARAMAERLLDDAREVGYRRVLLDTIEQMTEAIGLYQSLGFGFVEPYFENPTPGALHMELVLDSRISN